MPLKFKVDSLEGIDEALKEHYVELDNGDGFRLDVNGVVEQKEVEGLIAKRDQLLTEVKQLKSRYKNFDPDKYHELVELEDDLRRQRDAGGELESQLKAREAKLVEKHTQELTDLTEKLTTATKEVDTLLLETSLGMAMDSAGVTKEGRTLLRPHALQRMAVARDDSGRKVVVLGEDGSPRITAKAGSTSQMTPTEMLLEMRSEPVFQACFAADSKSGSGATGETSGDGVLRFTREELRKPGGWERAKQQAEKLGKTMHDIQVVGE